MSLIPFDTSVAVMCACLTTAPEESVTIPDTVPVVMPCGTITPCGRNATVNATQRRMRRRTTLENGIMPSINFGVDKAPSYARGEGAETAGAACFDCVYVFALASL